MNGAQASEPFFDIEAVIAASRNAAVQARKTAWEYRRRGDLDGYRRCVARAAEWRHDARRYITELEASE